MNTATQKHSTALELQKVLARLAECACCADTAELARNIEPGDDFGAVEREMTRTNDAYTLSMRFGSPTIYAVRNMNASLRRCQAGGCLSMRELLGIAEVLRGIRSLSEWRGRCENIETSLDELFGFLSPNKYLEDKITSAILSEEQMADNASPALADIRRKIRRAGTRAKDSLDKILKSPSLQKYLQEQIITMRDGRYVVPVKSEHKNEINGLVHDTSASGSTFFIEPMSVVEANNEIRVLESKEAAEIERILAELSAEAATFADVIIANYESLIELDLYFAKAKLAIDMKASLPRLNSEGRIVLRKARHPLIDPKKVVPIDLELGGAFDTLVITGPNTGGKTVSLKTLGLLTLMAACGLMLPVADNSEIAVFDRVLVDIGDEQSIEQSLSTFSAHQTNIISILGQADPNSLVLLDELGSGTDPVEGAALAVAIIERLRAYGSRVAATTHYAEIKMYALQTPGVENACCEFDVATLRPTYRLLIGIPGRSNAFAISSRLGMDEGVIERAKELVSTEAARFEDVVQSLEKARQEMENERQLAARLRAELAKSKSDAERAAQSIQKQKDQEIEKAREQAKKLVEDVRAEAEQIIAELDELRKQKNKEEFAQMSINARAQIRGRLNKLQDKADPVHEKRTDGYVLPRPLKAGDTVLIVDLDKKGTVLSGVDNGGMVQVQAGIIKTRVKQNNLRLVQEKSAAETYGGSSSTRGVRSKASRQVQSELDIRGKTVEEAYLELDQFIDNAVLSNIHTICIVHGKGTGMLRKGVQQYLRHHKSVKTYRLGVYGEGEDGVTIVELK